MVWDPGRYSAAQEEEAESPQGPQSELPPQAEQTHRGVPSVILSRGRTEAAVSAA